MKKIRVFPENKTLYFDVYLFETGKEMCNYANQNRCENLSKKLIIKRTGAIVIPSVCVERRIGHILFCKKYFNEIIIAHEVLHALIFYNIRKKFKLFDFKNKNYNISNDEKFCIIHSNMMKQILNKLTNKKII